MQKCQKSFKFRPRFLVLLSYNFHNFFDRFLSFIRLILHQLTHLLKYRLEHQFHSFKPTLFQYIYCKFLLGLLSVRVLVFQRHGYPSICPLSFIVQFNLIHHSKRVALSSKLWDQLLSFGSFRQQEYKASKLRQLVGLIEESEEYYFKLRSHPVFQTHKCFCIWSS